MREKLTIDEVIQIAKYRGACEEHVELFSACSCWDEVFEHPEILYWIEWFCNATICSPMSDKMWPWFCEYSEADTSVKGKAEEKLKKLVRTNFCKEG